MAKLLQSLVVVSAMLDLKVDIPYSLLALIKIFKHTQDSAKEITLKIHTEGSSVVGSYSYEIAEQKTKEAIEDARSRGFPLQVRME